MGYTPNAQFSAEDAESFGELIERAEHAERLRRETEPSSLDPLACLADETCDRILKLSRAADEIRLYTGGTDTFCPEAMESIEEWRAGLDAALIAIAKLDSAINEALLDEAMNAALGRE